MSNLTPARIAFALCACTMVSCARSLPTPTAVPLLPNPASVHCEEQGGTLELRTADDGSVSGVCVFADGSECDEWAYYRGECQPGDSLPPASASATPAPTSQPTLEPAPSPEPTDTPAPDAWATYHDDALGYRFDYPADATIEPNDNPLHGYTIVGPLVDDDHWPMITIDHPRDRDEYRPPVLTDLAQWLTDQMLLGDDRLPDTQIAGTLAIHTRHEASPQSYAHDNFFFQHEDQLYRIIIGHTAHKEDWEVYNRFLESFRFGAP
jgi:putative hemolysin